MVSLQGILTTYKITRNFWTAIFIKFSNKKKTIVFKNGVALELTWTEFCTLRNFAAENQRKGMDFFNGCNIQRRNDKFVVEAENYKVSGLFLIITEMLNEYLPFQKLMLKGYHIKQAQEGNLFNIQKGQELQFVGSLSILTILMELEEGIYEFELKDKVVLDIGGFQGETAVYFARQEARKVIVYEPIPSNCKLILQNLNLNQITNVELHAAGVGDHDGVETVRYNKIDPSFGCTNAGSKEISFNVKNIADVLNESDADIAKIDCEGAERHLINVRDEILKTINYYMIETHQKWIKDALTIKFMQIGYKLIKEKKLSQDIDMIYLLKNEKAGIQK